MFDFGAAHRTEGDRPGVNDKGLVTFDRKVRKDAFYFYKANWNKESTRCTSKTLYNKKGVRIDVENPNPTVRPGQVHVQTGNKKYIFDNVTKRFYDASNFDIAPKNIQNLLNDAEFVKKLNVGLEQYLGLQGVH